MTQPLFTPPAEEVARVALPVPADELFEYAIPAALAPRVQPGCRVQVRFRQRPLTGVVVERSPRPGFSGRLLAIDKLVDSEPMLSGAMLQILRDAAAELLCPIGMAVAAALPAGSAPRLSRGLRLTARGHEALARGGLDAGGRSALAALQSGPRLHRALRQRVEPGLLEDLERDGLIEACTIEQRPAARPRTIRVASVHPGIDVEAAARGPLARAPRQAALLRRLAADGRRPVAALAQEFPTAAALLRSLTGHGLVSVSEITVSRDVLGPPVTPVPPPTLTADQADALKPIRDAVRGRRAETFLLHGVTGSGKTEIYLRAVDEALERGRQALVLVPEITLTHQIVARLRERFGDGLAVLHSGLRPGERLEQWQRLRRGATPIAVGARSALFAPLDNLGVIVIDEEHDTAYKNDEGFRYHARDLARRRSADAGCPLILGSATPALETRYAADQGAVTRLVLPRRIGGRPLPAVEFVDLQRERERAPRGRKIVLSRTLSRAMAETLEAGGQTILLLNRRGFSTQVFCFDCGFAERCDQCDIALVYHSAGQEMRCHYCDQRREPPRICSNCGAPDTALLGLGTQRLEEEVRTRFPSARIARLDRDTAQVRGSTQRVLRELHAGHIDIIVGTQMIAKGHDIPGVRLVGVVLADVGLHLPDFRAAERTFQLLTQVAGRAGRDAAPGRVIVQTYSPDHYAVRLVRDHDYESFYAEELSHRFALGYPPIGHLLHVVVSGADDAQTRAGAETLAAAAPPEPGVEILGPAPAPLARLRGRHRHQILAKSADPEAVRRVACAINAAIGRLRGGVSATLDLRPIHML